MLGGLDLTFKNLVRFGLIADVDTDRWAEFVAGIFHPQLDKVSSLEDDPGVARVQKLVEATVLRPDLLLEAFVSIRSP